MAPASLFEKTPTVVLAGLTIQPSRVLVWVIGGQVTIRRDKDQRDELPSEQGAVDGHGHRELHSVIMVCLFCGSQRLLTHAVPVSTAYLFTRALLSRK
jgi:hypothetical protein